MPGPVNTDGLGATMRRTSGVSQTTSPRAGAALSQVVVAEVPAPVVGAVDPGVLGALLSRLGDRAPAFLTGLLGTWETETATSLSAFDLAVNDQDRTATGRLAHSIKGGSASMGAVELARVAGEIETAARGEGPLDLAQARDQLVAAVERARVGLATLSA